MTEALLYIGANSDVPFGRVSSTARRGDKWFNKVAIGDLVNLQVTETGETFGQAVIVEKELLPLADVLDNADHNHVAFKNVDKHIASAQALYAALRDCYGSDLNALEPFTVLHIIPIGQAPWELPEVAEHVARDSITDEPDFVATDKPNLSHELLENLIEAGIDVPGVAAVESTSFIGGMALTYRVEFEPVQNEVTHNISV